MRKIYRCKRSAAGELFGDAQWVQLGRNADGAPPPHRTDVRMCYSDDCLYVEFVCHDDQFNATLTGYNDKLYTEDVVEIFIDDDGDRRSYIEIEVNPKNAVLHYYVRNNLNGRYWGYARVEQIVFPETAVTKTENGVIWRVFFGIPMGEFAVAAHIPPKPGDRWLFNLYRIKTGGGDKPEYFSYSATREDNFHKPELFAELLFE